MAAPKRASKPAAKSKGRTRKTTQNRAAAAASSAKRAGAVGDTRAKGGAAGARMRLMRDSAIIARVHAGAGVKDVAQEFSVAQRTVQRVLEEFRSSPSPLESRPMDIVEWISRTYRRLIADFEAMAYAHGDGNPNVSLGAKKAAVDALERYSTLLADVGKLPDNLELFRAESEMTRIAELMVEKVAELEAGETTLEDVAQFFRQVATSRAPLGSYGEETTGRRQLEAGDSEEE